MYCACTGLPRKDMEWLFNTRPGTPAEATFTQLAATQPTSSFGEVYQYNNLMASAAGYLAARTIYPKMELGAAYDRAMQERIFTPLGMRSTTLSNAHAMKGNWAKPYDLDLDGNVAPVDPRYNETVVPYRPAGGAWSSAHDMALYVLNELNQGQSASGARIVSAKNLLARRAHNNVTAANVWYGMGLSDDMSSGVSVIQHGGSMFGYKSNWFALPEAGVGAVVLTNSDVGYDLTNALKRRLLETLYDGKPEAVETIASDAKHAQAELAKLRADIVRPAPRDTAAQLVGAYANADLGPLSLRYDGEKLMARGTSMWSEVGTRKNPDGSTSLITVSPGAIGLEFLIATRNGKPALVLNDAQHEYVFTPVKAGASK
jgi:CubicO group peptidase (beta-lactamase class C family)